MLKVPADTRSSPISPFRGSGYCENTLERNVKNAVCLPGVTVFNQNMSSPNHPVPEGPATSVSLRTRVSCSREHPNLLLSNPGTVAILRTGIGPVSFDADKSSGAASNDRALAEN